MSVRCHFLGLAAVAAVSVGCNRPGSSGPAASGISDSPVVVAVVSPTKKTLATTIDQPATIMPFEFTPVVAKLAGYVQSVKVDIGDVVDGPKFNAKGEVEKPGTLLAELDIPELSQEAEQKKAMVTMAGAEKEQAKQSLLVAQAQVTAAIAHEAEVASGLARIQADYDRWESEFARTEKMVAQKVLDSQTLDESRKQFRGAAAARDELKAKLASAAAAVLEAKAKAGRAGADVAAADAKVGVAAADANRVAALLGYTQIRAPFAGIVTLRTVFTGHFLQPSSGPKVDPLFTVARVDKLRVVLDVPEGSVLQAEVGAKTVVKVPALSNREFAGAVSRTAGVLSAETRTLRVEVDLLNPDGLLRPGMYATARIAGSSPDVTELPTAAVLFADEMAYAYRVQDGKVSKVVVRVGRTDGSSLEVLGWRPTTGPAREWLPLSVTDRFVTGHLGALADGQAVTIKKE